MPKPYPREFRDHVVRVARNGDGSVTLEQIAAGFRATNVQLAANNSAIQRTTTIRPYRL